MQYAWHPSYGKDVEVQYREARRGESVCVCRVDGDTSQVIPAWMFDPAFCARMRLGARHASVDALEQARVILRELGFDRAAAATHERPQEATDEAKTIVATPTAGDNPAGASSRRDPGGATRRARTRWPDRPARGAVGRSRGARRQRGASR